MVSISFFQRAWGYQFSIIYFSKHCFLSRIYVSHNGLAPDVNELSFLLRKECNLTITDFTALKLNPQRTKGSWH